jgi:adenosylmethionine-8-amino-7-oxononanoate aminotransferase
MNFLQKKDLAYHWHPCAQAKDLEINPPFVVKRAQGCYIEGLNGHKVIDGISSWWCKSLGHNHPRLKAALFKQAESLEHVISTTTTNKTLITLSEMLVNLIPGMDKVFYGGDGSSAIEIALKMSFHSRINQGEFSRRKFLSLANGYHGETCGALSVTQINSFKKVYRSLLFDSQAIKPIPYLQTPEQDLWHDCQKYWDKVESFLHHHHREVTAIILEPIVQGAGHMRIYSQDFLRRLRSWTKKHNIHLIADEIMTGLGRTGKMFACEHAEITPDFICLSKGLTSGWMPFSAVLTTKEIYSSFCNPKKQEHYFSHSHTYTGNPLGACIALETLKVIKEEINWASLKVKSNYLLKSFREIAQETKILSNVRGIGMIAAGDIKKDVYSAPKMKKMIHAAFEQGALLRPLGRTLYWLPPLNIDLSTIEALKKASLHALKHTFKV